MANYSIEFEVPSFHVQDSMFWKEDPDYYIQIVHYSIPEKGEQKVHDHYFNGKHKIMEFSEVYNFKAGAYLKIQQTRHGIPHDVGKNIYLGKSSSKYLMQFNQAYDKFALLRISQLKSNKKKASSMFGSMVGLSDDCNLRIFSFKDIKDLFKKIEDNKFDKSYDLKEHRYIKYLEFDQNDKYVVGYGEKEIHVMNLVI